MFKVRSVWRSVGVGGGVESDMDAASGIGRDTAQVHSVPLTAPVLSPSGLLSTSAKISNNAVVNFVY